VLFVNDLPWYTSEKKQQRLTVNAILTRTSVIAFFVVRYVNFFIVLLFFIVGPASALFFSAKCKNYLSLILNQRRIYEEWRDQSSPPLVFFPKKRLSRLALLSVYRRIDTNKNQRKTVEAGIKKNTALHFFN
jgi:hypothetical protein